VNLSSVDRLEWTKAKFWLYVIISYIIMLSSSLNALGTVTVSTVTVFRNLNTLLIAFVEFQVFQVKHSKKAVWSLGIILLGFLLHSYQDLNFDWRGYFWLTINIPATCFYIIYVKKLVSVVSLSVMGRAYYNNSLSLPPLLLLCILDDSYNRF
jgi:multidrug transporter EmrE-like cation transporter